jgi:chromosome segregation ATPase
MPRRGGTDELIERLQEEFDLDDIDESGDSVYRWLTKGKLGPHKIKNGFNSAGEQRYIISNGLSMEGRSKIRNLAAQIGESKRIYNEAGDADNIEDLDKLKKESKSLIFKKDQVTDFIDVKKREIQLSLTEAEIEDTQTELDAVEQEKEDLSEERTGIREQITALEQEEEASPAQIQRLETQEERLAKEEEQRENARKRLKERLSYLRKNRGKA